MSTDAKQEVRLSEAKGRPMPQWVGKRALRTVPAYPAQHIETFAPPGGGTSPSVAWEDWPTQYAQGGVLFYGDNKEVLSHLLANGFRGKVKLVYIDHPFDSEADYVRRVVLRGIGEVDGIVGEPYELGEQIQYND